MTHPLDRRRGSSMLEFTLVGIPLIFVLISIFEMARGMWVYATLAHAVREATRLAIVHGQNCATTPNQCQISVAAIAGRIRDAGVGLELDQTTVTMRTLAGNTVISSVPSATLASLLTQTGVMFPSGAGAGPGNDVEISATYQFRSAIAMFWPGAGPGLNYPAFNLPATSRDRIQVLRFRL